MLLGMILSAAAISYAVTLIVANVAEKIGGYMSLGAMAIMFIVLAGGLTALFYYL